MSRCTRIFSGIRAARIVSNRSWRARWRAPMSGWRHGSKSPNSSWSGMHDMSTQPVRYQAFIGGEFVDSVDYGVLESEDPFSGETWALVPRCTAADVDRAVEAAYRAFTSGIWAGMTASARGELLYRLGDLIAANAQSLADVEVRDNGKLMAEMAAQVRYASQWFRYFGGLADKIEGSVIPTDKPDMLNFTRREPLGVIAAIVPWNSPLLLMIWK